MEENQTVETLDAQIEELEGELNMYRSTLKNYISHRMVDPMGLGRRRPNRGS